jgi:hypothetical protein
MTGRRAWALLGLLVVASPLAAGETVYDAKRGFTLTVPDGFVRNADMVLRNPKISQAFLLPPRDDDSGGIVLLVEPLSGTIEREPVSLDHMPPGFRGRIFQRTWQGFEVDVIEVPETTEGVDVLTYNVQIPLKRAAVQLRLAGPADRRADLDANLTSVLKGFQGESNWLPSGGTADAGGIDAYGYALMAGSGLVIVCGCVLIWYLSRHAARGTALAVAAGFFVASWFLDGSRTREALAVSGSMRMLGVIGFVIALIGLFLKRKPPAKGNYTER